MVKIANYRQLNNAEGKPFFTLELQGGLELVKSNSTGKFYATVRTASVSTTFDEATCVSMIGQELPGSIQKVECEPYEYVVASSGEKVQLTYSWTYMPEA